MGQKIVAADVGFVATGLAVMHQQGPGCWVPLELVCVRPPEPNKQRKKTLYKAHLDAERVELLVDGIEQVMVRHEIRHLVAELPSGGAKGARANRCMALSTSMIVTLAKTRGLQREWYAQEQTRFAAIGQSKGKKKDLKPRIIEAMAKRYPSLMTSGLRNDDVEHVADALATFDAARNGNLVRGLSAAQGEL